MFKKLIKYFLIFLALPPLIAGGVLFYIIKSHQVDELLTHYPYYDKDKDAYVLGEKRPANWVEIGDVAEYAKWAVIVSEDWAFYEHPGVDLYQLKIALKESWKAGEFTRGASTITQQVVKNALLSPERTLWRKFQEVVLSLYLERIADKDKIMEIYLNIIELGDDVYGIGQASRFYFNKDPYDLNAREGAFLAMLLPSPVRYSASFYQKELSEFASEQVDSILVKLRQADIYDEEERLRQSAKKFYWEKSFYQSEGTVEKKPSSYDDYLEDSFL